MIELTRYWFEFKLEDPHKAPPGIIIGCGVTAYTEEDAFNIMNEKIFHSIQMPLIKKKIIDIDIRTLDLHVRPNILPPNWRGVWFPMGYD